MILQRPIRHVLADDAVCVLRNIMTGMNGAKK